MKVPFTLSPQPCWLSPILVTCAFIAGWSAGDFKQQLPFTSKVICRPQLQNIRHLGRRFACEACEIARYFSIQSLSVLLAPGRLSSHSGPGVTSRFGDYHDTNSVEIQRRCSSDSRVRDSEECTRIQEAPEASSPAVKATYTALASRLNAGGV